MKIVIARLYTLARLVMILFLNDNDSIENYIQVEEGLAIKDYANREIREQGKSV